MDDRNPYSSKVMNLLSFSKIFYVVELKKGRTCGCGLFIIRFIQNQNTTLLERRLPSASVVTLT